MSNNPTPPRIEREAEAFAQKVKESCYYPEDNWSTSEVAEAEARSGYYAGSTAQHNRAAPVVNALEEAYSIIANVCGGHPLLGELKQILETYKADV